MIRRIGQPPLPDQRYTLRAGVYAILPLQKRLLLTAQVSDFVDIQLPGGGVDPGESPIQALHREVMEETGWRIAAPKRIGAFRRFIYMPDYDQWTEKICHIYVARPTQQICEPLEPDHFTTVMDPAEAAIALGNDGDRMFVERFFGLRH
jgi:8-oxo-dGTP diphosphatase